MPSSRRSGSVRRPSRPADPPVSLVVRPLVVPLVGVRLVRFDSGAHTVKSRSIVATLGRFLRVLVAAFCLVAAGVVLGGGDGEVRAQIGDECYEQMPWSVADDWLLGSATDAFGNAGDVTDMQPAGSFAPAAVLGAGAAATASRATLGGAAAVGTFLVTSRATCAGIDVGGMVLDWVTADAKAYPDIPTGLSATVSGDVTGITGGKLRTVTLGSGFAAGSPMTFVTNFESPCFEGGAVCWDPPEIEPDGPFHDAGVWLNPSALMQMKWRKVTSSSSQCGMLQAQRIAGTGTGNCVNSTGGANTEWGQNADSTAQLIYSGSNYCIGTDTETPGIGGACGLPPGAIFGAVRVNDGALIPAAASLPYQPSYIGALWPELFTNGWYRQLVADVRCVSEASGGSGTWVRLTGAAFADAEVNRRVEIPHCPSGYLPVEYELSRLPINLPGGLPSLGNVHPRYMFERGEAPAEWSAGALAPDWVFCLSTGADCGNPVIEGAECMWNVYEAPMSFCEDLELERVSGDPTVAAPAATPKPSTQVQVVPAPAPSLGPTANPKSTLEPEPDPDPDPPDGSVTVNVPIDPGEGLGGGTLDDGAAECWPAGWGWFNPAQWVLKPIKCALVWAFVPSDIDGWLDDQRTALEGAAPFSWMFDVLDFLDEATTPVAGETGCFSGVELPDASGGTSGDSGEFCFTNADSIAAATGNATIQSIVWFAMVGMTVLWFVVETIGMLL